MPKLFLFIFITVLSKTAWAAEAFEGTMDFPPSFHIAMIAYAVATVALIATVIFAKGEAQYISPN